MRIGGELRDIERAFDAPKYSEFSGRPYLDVWIPTMSDSTLAPEGSHVVSIMVLCAPYNLAGGWTEERKAELLSAVLDTLDRYGASLRGQICAAEVLSPNDIEREYALSGGHLHQVESALDQTLFMRPTFSTARYSTPVEGLFLGGSGSHPGGGITGLPGMLAAKTVLTG